jgi:4-amino-4-deoxy-L-arabinose transferase-like glycosyltransferase
MKRRDVLMHLRPGGLLVLLPAFALRLSYLLNSNLYVDEYITALAARAVNQFGYPRLPSTALYSHGLPFVYVDAGLLALFGPSKAVARFPALLFGVMTIALVYRMGRCWFSPPAGLYAATILATTATSVIWGGRARMYTLQQLCFTLALFGLIEGFRQGSRRYRLVGLSAAVVALLCHSLTLAFLLAFALSAFLIWALALRSRAGLALKTLWPEIAIVLVGGGLPMAIRYLQGPWGVTGRFQTDPSVLLDGEYLVNHLLGTFHPFIVFPDIVLTVLFVTGSCFLVSRLLRGKAQPDDIISLLIWLTFLSGIVGMALFLTFKADRYALALVPLYSLMVGRELDFVRRRLAALVRRPWVRDVVSGLVWMSLACLMILPAFRTATSNPIVLDCAWAYTREHWKEGDAVATCMPVVAYEWLGRVDYFAMETGDESIETDEGRVDIWIGAPLVDSSDEMQRALASHRRLWFVVDERAWGWFYSDTFRSLLETEMERVSECPGMRVYVSDG